MAYSEVRRTVFSPFLLTVALIVFTSIVEVDLGSLGNKFAVDALPGSNHRTVLSGRTQLIPSEDFRLNWPPPE